MCCMTDGVGHLLGGETVAESECLSFPISYATLNQHRVLYLFVSPEADQAVGQVVFRVLRCSISMVGTTGARDGRVS